MRLRKPEWLIPKIYSYPRRAYSVVYMTLLPGATCGKFIILEDASLDPATGRAGSQLLAGGLIAVVTKAADI